MLEIRSIDKIYSEGAGVKEISFSSEGGEILALIGPNGAGKSTLLSMISGVLCPDKGQILLNQKNVGDLETRKDIGYLPDQISVSPHIKVLDLLHLVSDYKYDGRYKSEIEKGIAEYHLEKYCNEKFSRLSMGTKKKIGILIAFMGTPDLIILDEPTNGMDTHGILELKKNIMEAKEKGSIVIISSHILDFVNSIADRNLFLKDMKIVKIAEKNENLEKIYTKLYL